MKNSHSANNKQNGSAATIFTILIWVAYLSYMFFNHQIVLYSIFHLFATDVYVVLWNIFFSFICIRSTLKIWATPIIRILFADTQKIGQKLEWYDCKYSHLIPETKKLFWYRWLSIFFLTFSIYMLRFFPSDILKKYSFSFAYPYEISEYNLICIRFFDTFIWQILKIMGVFSVLMWILLSIEGRGRFLARFINYFYKSKEKKLWKMPLPNRPFSATTGQLDLCLFTSFTDQNNDYIFKLSDHEKWITLTEISLRANLLTVGPIGTGKTIGVVVPSLHQVISWQAHDKDKKASLIVYDPKAELTEKVRKIAQKYKRENDLLILSLNSSKTINPIQVKNIWKGETPGKIAGWIIAAWENYQGRTSPEPYWANQNYVLIKNILIMLYAYHGNKASLYDISKWINLAAEGCYIDSKNKSQISLFGEKIYIPYLSTLDDIDEAIKELEFPHFDKSKLKNISDLSISKDEIEKQWLEEINQSDEKLRDLIDHANNLPNNSEIENKIKKRQNTLLAEKRKKWDINKQKIRVYLKKEAIKLKGKIKEQYSEDNFRKSQILIKDACEWFFNNWSKNTEENRGSIISNTIPFLNHFELPELQEIFSPVRPNVDFDELVHTGSIIVPSFPAIEIGDNLANAIITLIKSRWQHSVLQNSECKRSKVQIMDEAQRVISFGSGGNSGDFEYMELSRSFGGVTIMLTQSLSALKAKAGQQAQFEKIHGVIRSIICLGTNDPQTIEFIQKIAGKEIKKRVSQTVTENASSPKLEMISEKYKGDNSSLSVSYTVSETMEDKISVVDLQATEEFTGIASIYDGKRSHLMKIALRPQFWSHPTDRWKFINKYNFDTDSRP